MGNRDRKLIVKRSVSLVAVFACVSTANGAEPFQFHEAVQPPRRVQIVANGGLSMLAPENSVEAVRESANDYIEWAAVAVGRTSDGTHVIVSSKPYLVNGVEKQAEQLTLAELRQIDLGGAFAPRYRGMHPSTLVEMLAAAKDRINLVLYCNDVSPASFVKEIEDAKMQSQVVLAGDQMLLSEIRDISGSALPTMAPFDRRSSLEVFEATRSPAVALLTARDATADRCRLLNGYGYKVLVSVLGEKIDQPQTWLQVIEAGADLILTDHPAEVRFAEVRRRIPQFPVMIACHRGANRYAPENTLPAITLAATLGADFIEIDIRTTQDGKFVLVHDGKLDRTTNGKGPVKEQTAVAVAALDAGSWFGAPFAGLKVPTFDEGLQALGRHSQAYLDAKDIAPEALLAAIRKHGLMERHAVYASPDYCRRLKELEPAVRLMPPLRDPEDLPQVAELHPYCVDANWSKLSKDVIDRCHAAGIKVFSDALGPHETLDDYSQAMDWGIDLIQTDYPLRVLRAIELRAPAQNQK
ncbi:MAG: glycerophosphodiester phosphodiesterase family protein [Planctomycetaceae bacterium]